MGTAGWAHLGPRNYYAQLEKTVAEGEGETRQTKGVQCVVWNTYRSILLLLLLRVLSCLWFLGGSSLYRSSTPYTAQYINGKRVGAR